MNTANTTEILEVQCSAVNLGVQLHLVTASEAALLLGCSIRTIRHWQAKGKMPLRVNFGDRLYYNLQDIARLSEMRGTQL